MRPLIVLSARSAALAVAIVLAIGLSGGVVRLLPWIADPDVPWRLSLPFARLLAGGAGEIAVLLGLPVGVAIGAAIFVERGESRALFALGASPERLVASLVGPLAAVLALYAVVAATADPEPPGRLAARLISAGRAACSGTDRPRRVNVPLVSMSWLCFAQGPRLAGRIPELRGAGWFTATDLRPSPELAAASLDNLRLAAQLGTRTVTVRAREVRLVGLPRWGKPLSVSGRARGAWVGFAAVAAALAGAWLVVKRALDSPLLAATLSGGAALAMLVCLRAADSRGFPLGGYALVPVAGLVSLGILTALLDSMRRIAGRLRA